MFPTFRTCTAECSLLSWVFGGNNVWFYEEIVISYEKKAKVNIPLFLKGDHRVKKDITHFLQGYNHVYGTFTGQILQAWLDVD